MFRLVGCCLVFLLFAGCATLPGGVKEGRGVAVLPLTFTNNTSLPDSLFDMVLYFNHDKLPVTVSPRNGYTVIETPYTDLQITGISFHPKPGALMSGGIGEVRPLSISLSTQPGAVVVSTDRIAFRQEQRKSSDGYGYSFNWYRASVGAKELAALKDLLKKDGNAHLWTFPEEAEVVEPLPVAETAEEEAPAP